MSATHLFTSKIPRSEYDNIVDCNGTYLACPHTSDNSIIAVWKLQDFITPYVLLRGHHKSITVLRFGPLSHPTSICSADSDHLILWNVDKAAVQFNTGQQTRGRVLATGLGKINYLKLDHNELHVAAAVNCEILIINTQSCQVDVKLEGHDASVNCLSFSPVNTDHLISVSDDRTFTIWDIAKKALVYRSSIISSSPFVSLATDYNAESFAVGTADGQVRTYDLSEKRGFRQLQYINIDKLLKTMTEKTSKPSASDEKNQSVPTVSSRPVWQQAKLIERPPVSDEEVAIAEPGSTVLALHYSSHTVDFSSRASTPCLPNSPFANQPNAIRDVLKVPPMLIIVTTGAVLQINPATLQLCSYTNILDPLTSFSHDKQSSKTLSITSTAVIGNSAEKSKSWCVLHSLFENELNVLSISAPSKEETLILSKIFSDINLDLPLAALTDANSTSDNQDLKKANKITVLSSDPLLTTSPLNCSEFHIKTPASSKKKLLTSKSAPGSLDRKGKIQPDLAITFHSSIKSTGYSHRPKKPLSLACSPSKPIANKLTPCTPAERSLSPLNALKTDVYPLSSACPTVLNQKLDVSDRATPINSLAFTATGSYLAAGLGNSTAQVFNYPLTGKGHSFSGHTNYLNCVNWSHCGQWLITASEDKSARVWSSVASDPILTFTSLKSNLPTKPNSQSSQNLQSFDQPVKFAQFFYMDKFVIIVSGNSFYLYKYLLDTTKSDLKRYLSKSRYSLVSSFSLSQAKQITAFSAINNFHSYLCLGAGSDKTLQVFDLNVGQSVRTISSVHLKPATTLCQNQGSPYVTHTSSAYDLFVTSSLSDCIKLWDLRTNRCVRRYEGHTNRMHPCSTSISPCARFIATGSEDKSVYVYDIKQGSYLHKLTGHTDTIGCVLFHPKTPNLIATSLDGKVYSYII